MIALYIGQIYGAKHAGTPMRALRIASFRVGFHDRASIRD